MAPNKPITSAVLPPRKTKTPNTLTVSPTSIVPRPPNQNNEPWKTEPQFQFANSRSNQRYYKESEPWWENRPLPWNIEPQFQSANPRSNQRYYEEPEPWWAPRCSNQKNSEPWNTEPQFQFANPCSNQKHYEKPEPWWAPRSSNQRNSEP